MSVVNRFITWRISGFWSSCAQRDHRDCKASKNEPSMLHRRPEGCCILEALRARRRGARASSWRLWPQWRWWWPGNLGHAESHKRESARRPRPWFQGLIGLCQLSKAESTSRRAPMWRPQTSSTVLARPPLGAAVSVVVGLLLVLLVLILIPYADRVDHGYNSRTNARFSTFAGYLAPCMEARARLCLCGWPPCARPSEGLSSSCSSR